MCGAKLAESLRGIRINTEIDLFAFFDGSFFFHLFKSSREINPFLLI